MEDAPRVRNVRRQLGLRPAAAATVDIARTSAEIERTARLTRWALWGALLVAAVVLFVVLGRGLSRRSAGT
jgi:t-SNARE complex subunit (syntaxin)